jgi:hypothetical protein
MTHIKQISDFLREYLPKLERDSIAGPYPEVPEFDLYDRDYLEFAEESLNRYLNNRKPVKLLNCLSHLKRAMDCQLETFLHAYGLADVFSKRNLSVDKKLLFVQACGIFSSRTLGRLNTFRNRMEHRFEIPDISDIEVYFDIVTAFVAILESAISIYFEQYFSLPDPDDEGKWCGRFSVVYDAEKQNISVEWKVPDSVMEFECTPDNIDEFAFMIKLLFLLRSRDSLASDDYILKQLECSQQQVKG